MPSVRTGQSIVQLIAAAADVRRHGMTVVELDAQSSADLEGEVRVGAERNGFVFVRPAEWRGVEPGHPLCARHLLVFCATARDRVCAPDVIRPVTIASPRRHVLALVKGESSKEHEGEPIAGRRPLPSTVERYLRRAEQLRGKGRRRAADRWIGAAAATARRAGDSAASAGIAASLVRNRIAIDEFDAAARVLRQYFTARVGWPAFAQISAARAELQLARGELALAEAQLCGLVAEARLRRVAVPAFVRTKWAELCFWRGRVLPLEGESPPSDGAASAEAEGWTGLAGWARGDLSAAATASAQLADGPLVGDNGASFWSALLAMAVAAPESRSARVRGVLSLGRQRHLPRRYLRLARGVAAWLSARTGRTAEARAVLRGPSRLPGLEAAFCSALLMRLSGDESGARAVARDLRRLQALGLEDLLCRTGETHVISGLPALVQTFTDADDDLAALSSGCEWVLRHAEASSVGFVDAQGARLIAARGWRDRDLTGVIAEILRGRSLLTGETDDGEALSAGTAAAPVRYSGATIGFVAAMGRTDPQGILREAVRAVAAVSGAALRARLDVMAQEANAGSAVPEILGSSPAIREVREAIVKAAGTTFPVLIEGESGTGKELAARAVHRLSARRERRFAALNCAALTDELVEAELFGHTRGAFTGAVGTRIGLFEEAQGGTLFLDEIGELSPRAQAKLLRVLQEREIRRLGENVARSIDVRIVAATNVPLAAASAAARFRDDLRFRIAVITIRMPPLRERLDDLPPLAQAFWRRAIAETGKRAVLGGDALMHLCRHGWAGNVRELQNVMAALAVAAPPRGRVGRRHVDQVMAAGAALNDSPVLPLGTARRRFERRLVAAALARHGGRRRPAALELGLTRQGLAKAVRRLGLDERSEAKGVA